MSGDGDETVTTDARACPSDGNSCTREVQKRGKCESIPLADGTTCDTGGTCQAGACVTDEGDGGGATDGTPTACVRPDASNTGAAGTLTAYTGSMDITTPGTVIENKVITGNLDIGAANVTIRNSRVTGRIMLYPGGDDALITGVTAESSIYVSSASRATIERSNVTNTGGDDALHVSSDQGTYIDGVTIRNNWIHNPYVPAGAHYDGLQVRGAANVLVECNNFDLGTYGEGYNAPVYFEWANGGFSNVRVLDNWLLGGAFNVMLSPADTDANRIVLDNNKVGGDYKWGLCMTGDGELLAKPKQQIGNTLNGAPVVPCP